MEHRASSQAGLQALIGGIRLTTPPLNHTPVAEPAPHLSCGRPGKFDCSADEKIHQDSLEWGTGEGDVQSPSGWFDPIELEVECEGHESTAGYAMGQSVFCDGSCTPEWQLAKHYGTRWLIARENEQGQFWVETYDTEQARDERLEGLRAAYAEWNPGVL